VLAYVFWHRPRPGVDVAAYEAALVEFHRRLGAEAVEGLHGSSVFATEDGGYVDWYHLEAAFALDALNVAAVSGPMQAPHEAVAALTGEMTGGLYRLLDGTWRRQMVLGPVPELPEPGGRRLF
jgi:hypothetical protein